MAPSNGSDGSHVAEWKLPDGFAAIPVHPVDACDGTPLRLCALVARRPDPATGPLLLLRDLPDARVYLGCVTDAAGAVREWVELWVQDIDGLQSSLPALREAISNQVLDERWAARAALAQRLGPTAFLCTGWERKNPPACFLDPAKGVAVQPGAAEPEGSWRLCRDEARLAKAGLPPYATSLARYLHRPEAGTTAPLVPVAAGAPAGTGCAPLEQAIPGLAGLIPFNPQGGLLLAQGLHPIPFDEYADLLGGKPWAGLEVGRRRFGFDSVHGSLGDWQQIEQAGRHLLLGNRGRAGRWVETFHLKVQLIAEAFRLAHAAVQQEQLPLLNLGADSFRVRLQSAGRKLPIFWTAQCSLIRPGDAFALPVDTGQFRYFLRACRAGASIYQPPGLGTSMHGLGSVRVRKVFPPESGRLSIEGTLVSAETISVSPRDLLWVRLPLASGRVDLYGHLYVEDGLASGEARFRTFPQALPAAAAAALAGAEGVSFPQAPFEVVPLHSSPCDLFSLGVLAVRALLVNEQNSHAQALDEMLSLARLLTAEAEPAPTAGAQVAEILARDDRYLQSLGPHRLLRDGTDPRAAMAQIPAELWADTLATIARCFPGGGPAAFCRDYGDAPSLALENAFQEPLGAWDKILVRSRSLLLIDWQANREIRGVIDRHRI